MLKWEIKITQKQACLILFWNSNIHFKHPVHGSTIGGFLDTWG